MMHHLSKFQKKNLIINRDKKKREICSFQMDKDAKEAYEYLKANDFNVSALLRDILKKIVRTFKNEEKKGA